MIRGNRKWPAPGPAGKLVGVTGEGSRKISSCQQVHSSERELDPNLPYLIMIFYLLLSLSLILRGVHMLGTDKKLKYAYT